MKKASGEGIWNEKLGRFKRKDLMEVKIKEEENKNN